VTNLNFDRSSSLFTWDQSAENDAAFEYHLCVNYEKLQSSHINSTDR